MRHLQPTAKMDRGKGVEGRVKKKMQVKGEGSAIDQKKKKIYRNAFRK